VVWSPSHVSAVSVKYLRLVAQSKGCSVLDRSNTEKGVRFLFGAWIGLYISTFLYAILFYNKPISLSRSPACLSKALILNLSSPQKSLTKQRIRQCKYGFIQALPTASYFLWCLYGVRDHLCDLVVRVSGYRSRGPGFDTRRFQIFWEAVGLERCPLSLVRKTEELLGRNSSGSGQKSETNNRGFPCADHVTLSIRKSWHYFANKRQSLGRHSSLADQGHGVFFYGVRRNRILSSEVECVCLPPGSIRSTDIKWLTVYLLWRILHWRQPKHNTTLILCHKNISTDGRTDLRGWKILIPLIINYWSLYFNILCIKFNCYRYFYNLHSGREYVTCWMLDSFCCSIASWYVWTGSARLQ
jgi:hypothetical protein